MDNTRALQAPAPPARRERQLFAGRYRLATFHRGDARTEVWRALDESTKEPVTLEFLLDRAAESRARFLESGRRMASTEQPSVMKVAAIHDDPDATFVVFEHIVHVPVPRALLKPVEGPAPILAQSAPPTVEGRGIEPVVAVPATAVLTAEASTPDVASDEPRERSLDALVAAFRARDLALIDATILKGSANELVEAARSALEDVHLETSLARARELLDRADMSVLGSVVARARVAAARALSVRPHVRVRTPHVSPPLRVRTIRIGKAAAAKPSARRSPGMPNRVVGRVRWGRVVVRGLIPGLLAAIVIGLPAELLRTIGNEFASAVEQRLRAGAATTPTLARATFELPPLSAYGATFETQAAYPAARPNGTVEWVVALRNTGSVGWYRGIDGAQASLGLADGTTAGVQTTPYVGPGQVGWFVVQFRAPAQPGTHTVALRPRIDGRGQLPDLGIYATVTVSTNP
jgi:hypothetical protein